MKVDIKVFTEYKSRVFSNDYCIKVVDICNLKEYTRDILDKHHAEDKLVQVKYNISIEGLDLKGTVAKGYVKFSDDTYA